ncbi:MAG: c-type cytochrome, partial [Thiogranum sp.]
MRATLLLLMIAGFGLFGIASVASDSPAALFQQHCASCHGVQRLGGMGPALLPENLGRLKPAQAEKVITRGRAATQMPAFGDKLDAAAIKALVAYIFTAPDSVPAWGLAEIRASHKILVPDSELSDKPVHQADPMNMFVVVELGDHHVSVLDGDKMEVIYRFKSHYALHGGPKYS